MEKHKVIELIEKRNKNKFNYELIGNSMRFWGKDMNSFLKCCEMLTETKGKFKMSPKFWAHNGSKFDGKFILDYYLNDKGMDLSGATYEETEDNGWVKQKFQRKPSHVQLVMVGTRALKITVKKMKFCCSLAHLSGALRNLPFMFFNVLKISSGFTSLCL